MRASHISLIAAALTLLTLGSSTVIAEDFKLITIQDLQGSNWSGEKEEVSVELFWEEESPHLRQRSPGATVVADVDPVNNEKQGTTDILLHYRTTTDKEVHTAVIGKLERTNSGLPVLTLLPAAKKFEFVPMSWQLAKGVKAEKGN